MKSFLNSSLTIVLLFIVGNLFFSSCHKDNYDPATASIPLLASISYYQNDGTLSSLQTFQYDTKGRLIKMIEGAAYTSTAEYSESMVTLKSYKNGNLFENINMLLDNKGLAKAASYEDPKELLTYEYDTNGYRKSFLHEIDTLEMTITFTVVYGNYISSLSKQTSKAAKSATIKEVNFRIQPALWSNSVMRVTSPNKLSSVLIDDTEKIDYLFYEDKINTIEYENMGISFEGKQNKNPIKQSTSTHSIGGSTFVSTIQYTYEYDNKGRITKQIADNGDYSVYTYVD